MDKVEMFKTYNCGIGMVIIINKNANRSKLVQEYKLIPMGKIIESQEEKINYELFF